MKVVLQDGMKDCGICCLLSVIRFFGGDVSKEYLRQITDTNKDGVSAYNLIQAAKEIGFDAYGMSGDLKKIEDNNLPCLAHINVNRHYQHFVVLYKIEKNKVTIMDPAKGKRVLKISEFLLMTTGNYIYLKPKKKLPVIRKQTILLSLFKTYLKKYFLLIFSFTSLILLFEFLISFYFKYILSYGIDYLITINIPLIAWMIGGISFLLFLVHNAYDRFLYKTLFSFDESVTFKTFQQLLLLPYFYYKNRTTGEVLARFHDLNTMKSFLVSFLNYFFSDLFRILFFFFLLFHYSKNLSVLFTGYIFFTFFYMVIRKDKKKKQYKKIRNLEDGMETYMIESISNVDTTKGSHLEKRFYDKFLLRYRNLLEHHYRYSCFLSLDSNIKELFLHILSISVYTIGAYQVIYERLSLSTLILYQTFFQYVLSSIPRFLQVLEEYPNFLICYRRVNEIFLLKEESFAKSYYFQKYDMVGDSCFQNFTFSLHNRILFDEVSLTIHARERILFFGNSGSGKSTLMKILLRYIDVPFGFISINGIDINHYHLENIRKYITYVTSNEMLYQDSIYQNICLYQEVSDEEFLRVIRITRVNRIFGEEVSNYKVLLEENGFYLSSGERQRLILARSLLRSSSIYIFDEAFGQIDIELTNLILKDVLEYLSDKTVIVISHRKNSKKYFNRLIKLDKGKLIDEKKL